MTPNISTVGMIMRPEDEVEALLPWFVAGTASDDERAMVKRALARDPGLQKQVDLIRADMAANRAAQDAVQMPDLEAGFDKLLARLAAEAPLAAASPAPARTAAERGKEPSRAGLLGSLMAPVSAVVDWVVRPAIIAPLALAGLLLVLGQAAVIAALMGGQSDAYGRRHYVTAAGPAEAVVIADAPYAIATGVSGGDIALIAFTPAATAAEVASVLASEQLRIVDGPYPGGIYRAQLAQGELTPSERTSKLDRLRSLSSLIRFVQPAAP